MKKLAKYLNKIRFNLVKYLYTNRLFISYFLISLCGTIILRQITIGNGFSFEPLILDIGLILLVGAFSYLVKPHNQFKYLMTWLIIFTILEFVNSIYYIFYASFASLSELSTLSQTETVADSIYTQLKIGNFVFLLQPIIFYYIHHLLKASTYYNLMEKVERKKIMFLATSIVGLILAIFSFSTASGTDYSRLNKQWNRSYIVERFGVIMYQANDIVQTIKPKISSLFGYEEALELFNDYFSRSDNATYRNKNKYTGILKGYNLVYIHMESMQTFLMNLEFNGEEVTPNLNKLSREGLFFSNFYPQVSVGTSSDAEYIMLTGLLPSLNGTVFVNYADNTFNTMATNLKERGYYTFSMHGNSSAMWNRNNIHPNLGYQEMFFKDTFEYDPQVDTVGLGINDEMFFAEALEKIQNIEESNKNYFGTLITLSNHSPFASNERFTLDINDYYENELGEEVSSCYLCDRNIGHYLVSSNYADKALGEFISLIKKSDAFNNTVFVFYGDHDAKISYKDMNYLYNYDYLTGELKDPTDATYKEYDSYDYQLDKKTPLIMWTKNKDLAKKLQGEVKTIMGMNDAAPTLYNMFNIDNPYVLGHDIFNIKNNNIVVFPNGNFLTDKVYYNNSTGEYKILKDDIVLDNTYIEEKVQYTEEALEIGNIIVNYDLFNPKKKDS